MTRVGGFVLDNLLTSLVTGIGTTVWLRAWGVPYLVLLGLFVAIATAVFYCAYRLFENYLLTPRVMGHTVRISPGLTIVATLIGGSLLGLVGALIAIPVAVTVHLVLEEVVSPRLSRA